MSDNPTLIHQLAAETLALENSPAWHEIVARAPAGEPVNAFARAVWDERRRLRAAAKAAERAAK